MLARPFLLILLYNKRDRSVKNYLSVMQTMGFEPTRANAHKTLNLACLTLTVSRSVHSTQKKL